MKPKMIAYSHGLNVIPFENVTAVTEDPGVTGQILVSITGRPELLYIQPSLSKDFIDQFNTYLSMVEGVTLEAKFIQDDKAGDT